MLLKHGVCHSPQCRFAHNVDQLRATDDMYKTSLCFMFMKSRCEAGSQCRHAHGAHELRMASSQTRNDRSSISLSMPHSMDGGICDKHINLTQLSRQLHHPITNQKQQPSGRVGKEHSRRNKSSLSTENGQQRHGAYKDAINQRSSASHQNNTLSQKQLRQLQRRTSQGDRNGNNVINQEFVGPIASSPKHSVSPPPQGRGLRQLKLNKDQGGRMNNNFAGIPVYVSKLEHDQFVQPPQQFQEKQSYRAMEQGAFRFSNTIPQNAYLQQQQQQQSQVVHNIWSPMRRASVPQQHADWQPVSQYNCESPSLVQLSDPQQYTQPIASNATASSLVNGNEWFVSQALSLLNAVSQGHEGPRIGRSGQFQSCGPQTDDEKGIAFESATLAPFLRQCQESQVYDSQIDGCYDSTISKIKHKENNLPPSEISTPSTSLTPFPHLNQPNTAGEGVTEKSPNSMLQFAYAVYFDQLQTLDLSSQQQHCQSIGVHSQSDRSLSDFKARQSKSSDEKIDRTLSGSHPLLDTQFSTRTAGIELISPSHCSHDLGDQFHHNKSDLCDSSKIGSSNKNQTELQNESLMEGSSKIMKCILRPTEPISVMQQPPSLYHEEPTSLLEPAFECKDASFSSPRVTCDDVVSMSSIETSTHEVEKSEIKSDRQCLYRCKGASRQTSALTSSLSERWAPSLELPRVSSFESSVEPATETDWYSPVHAALKDKLGRGPSVDLAAEAHGSASLSEKLNSEKTISAICDGTVKETEKSNVNPLQCTASFHGQVVDSCRSKKVELINGASEKSFCLSDEPDGKMRHGVLKDDRCLRDTDSSIDWRTQGRSQLLLDHVSTAEWEPSLLQSSVEEMKFGGVQGPEYSSDYNSILPVHLNSVPLSRVSLNCLRVELQSGATTAATTTTTTPTAGISRLSERQSQFSTQKEGKGSDQSQAEPCPMNGKFAVDFKDNQTPETAIDSMHMVSTILSGKQMQAHANLLKANAFVSQSSENFGIHGPNNPCGRKTSVSDTINPNQQFSSTMPTLSARNHSQNDSSTRQLDLHGNLQTQNSTESRKGEGFWSNPGILSPLRSGSNEPPGFPQILHSSAFASPGNVTPVWLRGAAAAVATASPAELWATGVPAAMIPATPDQRQIGENTESSIRGLLLDWPNEINESHYVELSEHLSSDCMLFDEC